MLALTFLHTHESTLVIAKDDQSIPDSRVPFRGTDAGDKSCTEAVVVAGSRGAARGDCDGEVIEDGEFVQSCNEGGERGVAPAGLPFLLLGLVGCH